jgi:hypothetical protein
MATVNLYGVSVPDTAQKVLATAVSAGEADNNAWTKTAAVWDKLGFTSALIRMPYGEDKASHKQLTALIVAGLPARMQTAMAKPAKARSDKDKDIAATGQKRVGVYRVRLGKYLDDLQTTEKPEKVEKTTAHELGNLMAKAIKLLGAEMLTGLPNGYRVSEHIGNLKNEYKAAMGLSYKDPDSK